MVSWLQKIPSGGGSREEGENDEMTVQTIAVAIELKYVISFMDVKLINL